ncbi:MAG: hypothetical protein J6U36_07870 [Oscillospiraceae bacterium]|nr:hypothetical protein [Oscillospiraceae bacterium]
MAENNHNLDGISAPVLEETTYDPSKAVKRSLDGIQAPTLEETSYTPEKKTAGLDDVAAPVLADTFTPGAAPQYGAPQNAQAAAPNFQQYGAQNTQAAAPQFQQYGAQNPQAAAPQFQQYGAQAPQAAAPAFQQYGAQNPQAVSQPFQQYGAQNSQATSQPFGQYGAQAPQAAAPQFQQYGAHNPQATSQPFQQYGAQNPQAVSQPFQQYGAQNAQATSQPFQQYGAQATSQPFQQYGAQNAQAVSQPFQQYGGAGQTSRNLDDVQKPVLADEPQTEQRYVPKFVDPDLENAKKTAVDRAIKSSLNSVPESFDKEKSREVYREFMREKEADLARKGGMLVIVIMVIGMISGLLTLLYSFMALKDETPAFLETCNMCTTILGIIFLGGAGAMLVKSNTTRKIASNIFTFGTVLHVIPGLFVMFSKVQGTAKIMYLAVLVINIIICFSYGSSEAIKKHYNGHDDEAYY